MELIANEPQIRFFYTREIFEEYNRVLSCKKLNIAEEKKNYALSLIQKIGILIVPSPSNIPMPDETDRIFYDTAKASNSILITGNTKHYPVEPFIMTPTEFLTVVFA